MKVKELIEALSKLPAELPVCVEDGQDPSATEEIESVEIETSPGGSYYGIPKGDRFVRFSCWKSPQEVKPVAVTSRTVGKGDRDWDGIANAMRRKLKRDPLFKHTRAFCVWVLSPTGRHLHRRLQEELNQARKDTP
jgi:hypothetical protein